MARKVKLELTPYNSLAILSFLREWVNDENKDDFRFKAIHDAVDEYEEQILMNTTHDQIDDAVAENEVNRLIGKWPIKK